MAVSSLISQSRRGRDGVSKNGIGTVAIASARSWSVRGQWR